MQSKGQNKLLGDWIRNESELALVLTYDEKRIGDYDKEDMTKLVELMGKWRLLLGVNSEVTATELVEICRFVFQNFKKFTLSDVNNAMNWAISGKTDMTFVSSKTLSAMYVSKALNLYEDEKRAIINKVAEQKAAYEAKLSREQSLEVTPEQKAEIFKTTLINGYSDYQKGAKIFDFGDFIYNWLKNNKIITPTQKEVSEAVSYGEAKFL